MYILKFLTLETKSYCLTLLANLAYCSSSTLCAVWFNDVSFATLCRADNGSHFVTHDPSSNWPMTGVFERLSATFDETETCKGRGYVWKANIAHVCFVWKWKKLENLFKCPLVNETLWSETETFGFQSETRPRPRPSHTLPRPRRDRDVWKIRLETVSRPRRRDRDYNSAGCGCTWLMISKKSWRIVECRAAIP